MVIFPPFQCLWFASVGHESVTVREALPCWWLLTEGCPSHWTDVPVKNFIGSCCKILCKSEIFFENSAGEFFFLPIPIYSGILFQLNISCVNVPFWICFDISTLQRLICMLQFWWLPLSSCISFSFVICKSCCVNNKYLSWHILKVWACVIFLFSLQKFIWLFWGRREWKFKAIVSPSTWTISLFLSLSILWWLSGLGWFWRLDRKHSVKFNTYTGTGGPRAWTVHEK